MSLELYVGLSGELTTPEIINRFDGCGLLRGEYVARSRNEYITAPSCQEALANYLDHVCSTMYPKQVWYRTMELEISEVNVLDGVDVILEEDPNPMLGLRGIRRAMELPGPFRAELDVLAHASSRHGNLCVMFPFVADAEEFEFGVTETREAGFEGPLGSMIEIPSAISAVPDLCKLGMERATVGMNDLTSLILGAPRGDARANFSHPAVIDAISQTALLARPFGCHVSVAGYFDENLAARLADIGVNSATMHYAMIPRYLGNEWTALLPEMDHLLETKERTRGNIRNGYRPKTSADLGLTG